MYRKGLGLPFSHFEEQDTELIYRAGLRRSDVESIYFFFRPRPPQYQLGITHILLQSFSFCISPLRVT